MEAVADCKLAFSVEIASNFAVDSHILYCKMEVGCRLTVQIRWEWWRQSREWRRLRGCRWKCASAATRLRQPSAWLIGKLRTLISPKQKRRDGGSGGWKMVDGEATNLTFSTHRLPTSDPPQASYGLMVARRISSFAAMIQKKRYFLLIQDVKYR